MRIRSIALGSAAITALALGGSLATAQAAKRIPLAYGYGCKSRTASCPWLGSTDVKSTRISVGGAAVCSSGEAALSQLGYLALKHGKASVRKTIQVTDSNTGVATPVTVAVTVKLKIKKSASGTVKVTTTAKDCAAQSGRTQKFTIKYSGPIYGG